MHVWIDNDGCPKVARELVFRAAERLGLGLTCVANSWMRLPSLPQFRMVVVPGGLDKADDHIAENVAPHDLVITSDIPLAARVVAQGAVALSPRGEVFDARNVGEKLATRNLMAELRSAGDVKGGPPPPGEAEKRAFAAALDRLLTALRAKSP